MSYAILCRLHVDAYAPSNLTLSALAGDATEELGGTRNKVQYETCAGVDMCYGIYVCLSMVLYDFTP